MILSMTPELFLFCVALNVPSNVLLFDLLLSSAR